MRELIDDLMPDYDVRQRHHTVARADVPTAYAAIHRADLGASPLARALLLLRALPAALLGGRAALGALRERGAEPITLATLARRGFRVVAVRAGVEVVMGLEGRFWRPGGGLCTPPAEAFDAPPAPGTARAVWNFTVRERAPGNVEIATETRVRCADAAARRRFTAYWCVVRPGSSAIRRAMLRAIRDAAEGAA